MEAAGSLGKSMRQILSGTKVIEHVKMGRNYGFGDVSGAPTTTLGPRIAC